MIKQFQSIFQLNDLNPSLNGISKNNYMYYVNQFYVESAFCYFHYKSCTAQDDLKYFKKINIKKNALNF
jgi:hypothetical protein